MRLPIFKTGTHTDSSGKRKSWTIQDLDAMVSKYNNQPELGRHEAPLVLGHPKDNSPAYGWVEKLDREGEILYATLKDMKSEFVQWVKDKHYKYRSASIYPDLLLRHVGFLGGNPPAIKGLGAAQFSASEAVEYSFADTPAEDFADPRINVLGRVLLRIRDYFIEKEGTEKADLVINPWDIQQLMREPAETGSYTEREQSQQDTGLSMTESEIQNIKAENERLKADKAAQQTQMQQLQLQRAKDATAARLAGFRQFCESDAMKGKVTPAIRPRLYALYEHTVSGDTNQDAPVEISFSERDGDTVVTKSQKIDDLFRAFAESLPASVSGDRVATRENVDPKAGQDFSEAHKAANLILGEPAK